MSTCEINGEITDVRNGMVTVNIKPESACASCGAKSVCGSGRERTISIVAAGEYQPGDKISIRMSSNILITVTFLLYFFGMALSGIISFVAFKYGGISEVWSAALFLILVFAYLPIAGKVLAKKYGRRVHYSINKDDKS